LPRRSAQRVHAQSGLGVELVAPTIATQGAVMQLIGMLDSPYVRRVAVSLQLLGVRFQHQSLSVFRTYTEFQKINPVVKAPTVVCDDGTVLMDVLERELKQQQPAVTS